MDSAQMIRLLPTMEVIEEAFQLSGLSCTSLISQEKQVYRSARLFSGQQEFWPDVLYILGTEAMGFPVDRYAYLCTNDIPGKADHICCPNQMPETILDFLMDLYAQYQQQEILLDQLVFRGASLEELCQIGEQLLDNPVSLHDDWFMVLASSSRNSQYWTPEPVMSSAHGFIPKALLDDFKYDNEYLETYTHREARIWVNQGLSNCLYVNLWEGTVYRGRLLVAEMVRPFQKKDFILAEVLAQRFELLLRANRVSSRDIYQSMDDMMLNLLQGTQPDITDLSQLLGMLNWNRNDQLLCIRLQSQDPVRNAVMENLAHSDLFRCFPDSYILLRNHQQCVILNLSQQTNVFSGIRQQLAPLCRDYCLYAGISSPVAGIRELHTAYYQAGIALDQAFSLRSDKWILHFSDCVLEHIINTLPAPLLPKHLVAPELTTLLEYDKEKGTEYFKTLREYLLQERDAPRTAEKLIIHRTTLRYRLKKIHSLIHLDLDDPWQRLYLMLSLWILEDEP